ncbi:putative transcription factor B3-Domain family [Medicago truncatula]|uniref:Putative transcription factor B3-Domain family n=1 Tax=Medicago truncatula TaxID=3880 RepID=A0A396JJ25_MEDTR|nr:putative transcription factor B3-Domain family [Medicago truncatula]
MLHLCVFAFENINIFLKFLLQRIPKKYVEKFWKRISNPIFLQFPNGVQQKIFWVESNGDIWFQKNWENFAKFLKYGYLLTFKYIGGSYFKVKIFGANTLEINYSNIKSVEEVVEAKEGVEVSGDSDKSLGEGEIPLQAQRTIKNGKRKNSVDLYTTQPIFSGEFFLS